MVASPSVLERVASLPWPGIASFRQRIPFARRVSTAGRSDACDGRDLYAGGEGAQLSQLSDELPQNAGTGVVAPASSRRATGPAGTPAASVPVTPLHPYVLPYAAIDFDDASKVQQAVETTSCLVQYRQYGAVCVAVGSNPGRFHLVRRADLPVMIWSAEARRARFARHPPRAGDARHARADVAMGRAL